uniref:Tectonic-1-3 N-terminal domain-containing protein n=1 Tax=Photinus pyralis TaxID=7054 RepID=A0A1Y1JWQ1_PHOPY
MILFLLMVLHYVAMDPSTVTPVTETSTELTTTTPVSSSTMASVTSTQTPINHTSFDGDVDTCTCNLHRNICDLNCCCDKDCSLEDKNVFSHCVREINVMRDTSFCRYTDYIYINNTPYEWEVNQNGLFCIVKTNLPSKRAVQTHQAITSLEQSTLHKRDKYSWPDIEADRTELTSFANESFVYGSPIWILKNQVLQKFELADSFMTNACVIKRDIKYLENFRSVCIQTNLSEGNIHLQIETYFQNISVIKAPQFFNVSEISSCPKNVCLPIEVKECRENCAPLSPQTATTCQFYSTQFNCSNLAHKIIYNLYHNGTYGLTTVELLLHLKDLVHAPDHRFEFEQEFQVNFFWRDSTANYSQLLSGNPGYLLGKPVLVGTVNGSRIERNSSVFRENFLTFPASRSGLCVLNDDVHVVSEFGCSMLLRCGVRREIDAGNSTATELCRRIQTAIFEFWPLSSNLSAINRAFGAFGNANETVAEWVEALSAESPEAILNATYGNFTGDANDTLICGNVTATLKVDVFHARVAYRSLMRQRRIVGVTYSFGARKRATFTIRGGVLEWNVLIREELMFFDVTSKHVEKFADPPSFKIRLPYDFFYPFVKVDNSGGVPRLCYLVISFSIIGLLMPIRLSL